MVYHAAVDSGYAKNMGRALGFVFLALAGCGGDLYAPPASVDTGPVDEGPSGNTAPVANEDVVVAWSEVPKAIRVTANDDDDGDSLVITDYSQPARGYVSQRDSQTLVYYSEPDIPGRVTFTYEVADGFGLTSRGRVAVDIKDPRVRILGRRHGRELDGASVDLRFEVEGCTLSSPGLDLPDGCHLWKLVDGEYVKLHTAHYDESDDADVYVGEIEGVYEVGLVLVTNRNQPIPNGRDAVTVVQPGDGVLADDLLIDSTLAIDEFCLLYHSVEGDVTLAGGMYVDIGCIQGISGTLRVVDTPVIELGLPNLTALGGLEVRDNPALTTIDFPQLSGVTGDIVISGNAGYAAADVDAFAASLTIGGETTLADNGP